MAYDLDDLLSAASPPVTERSDSLDLELRRMMGDAEALVAASKRGFWRRVAVSGTAVASLLALGAGASAVGLIDLIPRSESGDWLAGHGSVERTFTLASGEACEVTYAIEPLEVEGVAQLQAGMSADEWNDTLTDAQKYMAAVDIKGIDIDAAVAKFKRSDAKVRQGLSQNGVPASEMAPALSADQTRVLALGAELLNQVQAQLVSDGHDPAVVTIASGNKCRGLM